MKMWILPSEELVSILSIKPKLVEKDSYHI